MTAAGVSLADYCSRLTETTIYAPSLQKRENRTATQKIPGFQSDNMTLALVLSLVLIILGILKLSLRPAKFPPGPRGLPLVGYAPFFFRKQPVFKALQELAKKYGPVTGFYVGPQTPFIAVLGPDAVKKALQNDSLNGRPSGYAILSRTFGEKLGVFMVEGEPWKIQRRFTLRHLRDLGFGKTSIENIMMEEIHDLISEMKSLAASNQKSIITFKRTFTLSVINVLWAVVGGERYARDDIRLQNLFEGIHKFFRAGNPVTANIPVPSFIMKKFPIVKKFLGMMTDEFVPLQNFLRESIEQHKNSRNEQDHPRDFIDVYLDEMKADCIDNPHTTFTYKQLIAIVQDLFLAGTDTTNSSIGFALLHLIHHQDIQKKLQEELDSVCGSALPSLALIDQTFLMEVQRVSSIAPITAPHSALNDTELMGYFIPKGSIVSIHLHSVLNDVAIWGDPENFRPERFIDSNGKLTKPEWFIPFGHGKRICLGESLARNSLYLFFAALAKTFQFKPVDDSSLPSLDPEPGFTVSPKPFDAIVLLRHHAEE